MYKFSYYIKVLIFGPFFGSFTLFRSYLVTSTFPCQNSELLTNKKHTKLEFFLILGN
jgi:hypothetical protein